MTLRDELNELYNKLPKMTPGKCAEHCRAGKCLNNCCNSASGSVREKHNINRYINENELDLPYIPNQCGSDLYILPEVDGVCAYYINNQCAIYDVRPAVCRMFGAIKGLECTYFLDEAKAVVPPSLLVEYGIFPENVKNISAEAFSAMVSKIRRSK